MSKQLILNVTCANDFADDDVPSVFAIQIGADLAGRIKMLAAAVKDLGVDAVEEFNYDGTWSPANVDASGATEPGGVSAMLEAIESDSASVEIPMIHVSEHSFYFTSVPRHADDSFCLTTKAVEITALDGDEPLLVF